VTGGHAISLSRAERELGLFSDTLYFDRTFINYPSADIALRKSKHRFLYFLKCVETAFKYPKNYDILHFNFGSTLIDFPSYGIHHWDLPLYKKQKLFVTYNGSDARLSFDAMCPGASMHPDYANISDTLYPNHKQEFVIKKRIKQFEDAGAFFFARTPDLLLALPGGAMFLPQIIYDLNAIESKKYLPSANKLKVFHAPTSYVKKGTHTLVKAVESLLRKYPDKIELQLVTGADIQTARTLYKEADVVVDQLRIGWYGGLAVEVMKMGVPVIVHINHNYLNALPAQMGKDCLDSVIEADSYNIENVLEFCIQDRAMLQRKALAGSEYVNMWHNPTVIATRVKQAYEQASSR